MEPKDARIKRFEKMPPDESIETLLNSISNSLNRDIQITIDNKQPYLLILGIHSAALTISEALFNKTGPDGFRMFLEYFINKDAEDKKFSEIADHIHGLRNIFAHQWLGSKSYEVGFDFTMEKGWEKRDKTIYLNPYIYGKQYLEAFSSGGKIWKWKGHLEYQTLQSVKDRIIEKFKKY